MGDTTGSRHPEWERPLQNTPVDASKMEAPNHIYSVTLMKKDSEWCVYYVKVRGDVHRDFFVETTAEQNARGDAMEPIEAFCESQFDKLPENGGIISLDLKGDQRS